MSSCASSSVTVHDVVIIGAGPAGLTAAYELSHQLDKKMVESMLQDNKSAERKNWSVNRYFREQFIESRFTSDQEQKYTPPSQPKSDTSLSILVLEGRDRVGGRVHSIKLAGEDFVETGAAFIQGKWRHAHSFYYVFLSSR
jgi:hypothetical protein